MPPSTTPNRQEESRAVGATTKTASRRTSGARLPPDAEAHVDAPGGKENDEGDRDPANPGEERSVGVRVHLRAEDRPGRPPCHARGVVDPHPPAAHAVLHDLVDPRVPGGEEQRVADAEYEPERQPQRIVTDRWQRLENGGNERKTDEHRSEEAEARNHPRRASRHEHDAGELGGRIQPERSPTHRPSWWLCRRWQS